MRDVTVALQIEAILGEGPRWHGQEQCLYWVDIDRKELHRFDPASGQDEVRRFDQPVACFAFREGGGFVLGMKDGCALLDSFDGEVVPFGPQLLADRPSHRFNDGRTDRLGRFWLGSMNGAKDAEDAALYRLDGDASLTEIESGMLTCNGAAFSADGRHFTHTDTPSHRLRLYDVTADGAITNSRTLHQFEMGTGRPDGGSFDSEGCYWSALFDGSRVVRLNMAGEILETVDLPAKRPTMITFGGDGLKTAYVTTARTGLNDAQLAEQPLSGSIFSFRVEVPGIVEFPFAG